MEKAKIGRNDPCPCGSGKKYKKCCYPDNTKAWKAATFGESPAFIVKPKEKPEPIKHHLVSSNGGKTWKPQPGLLAMQICGKKPEDIDEAISTMINSILINIRVLNLPISIKQEYVQRISEVDHKLHAVKYHLNNYVQAESDNIEKLSENYRPPTGAQMVIEEPRLIYEVEAFLFQAKSCLDVLSRVLKPVFGFAYCSFGDNGDDIIKQLKNNTPATLTVITENIIKLIEDSQGKWIVELIKMRDQVTHYSKLQGFQCFQEDPYMGGEKAIIHYPTMPNTRRALDYCREVWDSLLKFCSDFLKFTYDVAIVKFGITANPS